VQLFLLDGGRITEADLDFFHEYLESVVDEDIFATVEIEKMLTNIGP